MSAQTSPAAASKPAKEAEKPAFDDFVAFAERWLLPLISVRLAEGQRENTWTWCGQWWEHRPVAVRIAHLHNAFEALRGVNASTFVTSHVDAHMRILLDAAKGPLHRCTPVDHVPTPSLTCDPLPARLRFPPPPRDTSQAEDTDTADQDTPDNAPEGENKPPPRFAGYGLWVRDWLLPVTSARISAAHREGTYTWCARWWEHHSVSVRFGVLHKAFEAAVVSKDKTAMSTLFTRNIDAHMRVILDAANGPLHRCTPEEHRSLPSLTGARVPRNWFGPPGARIPVEQLGFAPDFRAFSRSGGGGTS